MVILCEISFFFISSTYDLALNIINVSTLGYWIS